MEIKRAFAAPGRGPAGLAWDGEAIWNADFRDGHLYRLAPADGAVRERLLCPGVASGLAWDGHHLWQAVLDEGWLRAIDPADHDFDRTVVITNAGRPAGVAWDGRLLWVVSQERGKLLALDPETEEIVRAVEIPVGAGGLAYRPGELWLAAPEQMQFDARTRQFAWTSTEHSFFLIRLEPERGREIARYALDFLPLGLAWVGETLWLSNGAEGALYMMTGIDD